MLALQAQVDQSRTESIDILFQLSIGNRNEFAARNIFLEISGMIPVKFRGTVDQDPSCPSRFSQDNMRLYIFYCWPYFNLSVLFLFHNI